MHDPTMPSTTEPECHFPGETYVSERNTHYDYNFLTPTPMALRIAEYALAAACEEARQVLHVETWFPSMRRGIATCPNGNRSVFHHRLHMRFSALYNPHLDNVGNVIWKPDEVIDPVVSDGESPTLRDARTPSPHLEARVLAEILGPVTAQFADNRADYGGLCRDHRHWGTAELIERPPQAPKGYRENAVLLCLPTIDWLDRVLAVEDHESSPELLAHCRERGALTPAQARYLDRAVATVIDLRRQYPEAADDDPMFWAPFISAAKLREAKEHYEGLTQAGERRLRFARRKNGPSVLGKDRLRNIDPWSFRGQERTAQLMDGVVTPAAPRTRPSERPTKAESDGRRSLKFIGPARWVARMLETARTFVRNHRNDLNAWRNGRDFAVSFPYGTVRQRLHSKAVIRDGP